MRIAYICTDPGVPVFGRKGCTVHVQEVVRAFRAQRSEVVLFAARLDGDPPPDLTDLPVHRLPSLPKGDPAAREQAAFESNAILASLLEREGPFDVVYERYALWSYAGMAYARAQGIPGLLEVNAPLIEEQAAHRGLVDRALAERVAERSFRAASALVAVSGGVARYLNSQPGTRGRVHVVPNGVRADRFPEGLAPSRPAPAGAYTVGFVGTLKPWHGLPVLVEAFALLHERVPAARLLLVGDGPERAGLEDALAARGLREAACFTGAVSPEAVPGLLASMDVAVAPYPPLPDFYFSPLKVFEYMAAGRPVVASRIGQLEELVEDGVDGVLCPPGDPEALATALHVLHGAPAQRAAMGEAARATVRQHHTWEHVAERLLHLAETAPVARPRPEEVA